MKYNVGDKVKIRTNLVVGETYDGCFFNSDMCEYLGKEAIITTVDDCDYTYHINLDGGEFWWNTHMLTPVETVNHPSHYKQGIEAIDYIESHNMNFNTGNVIKYVTRAKHKGTELEDLRKASWYLNREIENLEKEGK